MNGLGILTDRIASIPDVNLQILLNRLDLNVKTLKEITLWSLFIGQKILGYLRNNFKQYWNDLSV